MENNQKINCTVGSCKYNDWQKQECLLKQIVVEPIQGRDTKNPDESMCGSYKNQQEN